MVAGAKEDTSIPFNRASSERRWSLTLCQPGLLKHLGDWGASVLGQRTAWEHYRAPRTFVSKMVDLAGEVRKKTSASPRVF